MAKQKQAKNLGQRAPAEISDEQTNYTKNHRLIGNFGRGPLTEVFGLFLVRYFVLKIRAGRLAENGY